MNIEPTQEFFLQTMRELGFTEDEIEEARKWLDKRVSCYDAMIELGLVDGQEAEVA